MAEIAREKEIQFIISTHSPYVLEELPAKGRICIVETDAGKTTVTGVSPEFAMSRMDEENHPECDVYVEDEAAAALMREAIVSEERDMISRVQIISFGAASVGISLGLMVKQNRFPTKSVVFLDGDQDKATGVFLLPGDDAPERVVFEALNDADWPELSERLGRQKHQIKEAMSRAMTLSNHHDWVSSASEALFVTSTQLWQVMCAAWMKRCATDAEKKALVEPIRDVLEEV